MQLLVTRGLLAEEELDPPLLGLSFRHGQQVIVPLEDLMGWIGRFISREFIASAEGDEDDISTGIGNSTLGGLAC
jgi:hypothetical protein